MKTRRVYEKGIEVVKRMGRVVREDLGSVVLGTSIGLVALISSSKSKADIVIKTVPERSYWVADSTTEYKVDVIADTTEQDATGIDFRAVNWDVVVPSGLDVTRAELPGGSSDPSNSEEDYFYLVDMVTPYTVQNTVISVLSGNKLKENNRLTESSADYVSNNSGVIGCFYFIANQPNSSQNFGLTGVVFTDKNGLDYNILTSPSVRTSDNPLITIGAGHIPGDFDGDGDVDQNDFGEYQTCISGPSIPYTCGGVGDAPQVPVPGSYAIFDFDMDGDIDQTDFGGLQRCMTGEGVIGDYNCLGSEFSEYNSALNPHLP